MVSERVKVHIGLAAALIVFIVCVTLLIIGQVFEGDLHAALPGSVAPDFALRDAENNPVKLADLRGNIVIVYFHGNPPTNISDNLSPSPATAPSVATALPQQAGSLAGPAIAGADVAATGAGSLSLQSTATPASTTVPDLSQLSAICRELHSARVKVLDLENPAALASADPSLAAASSADGTIETLIDPTGDVARKYRIDEADTKPTFFVIDPSGIIRYRGNSAIETEQLLSPATQPSSCPQIIPTILSSEAINVALPESDHF